MVQFNGFQEHGAYPGLPGIGHWSTYINNGSGSIGTVVELCFIVILEAMEL